MPLISLFKSNGPSGFSYGSTAEQVTDGVDLTGKRVLITGCNSGIGFESMRVLALRGATVLGLTRSQEKAAAACAAVAGATEPVVCELSDPESVAACVRSITGPIDVILANAGVMALPKNEQLFGIEKQLFVNHIGHFMLITGLLDQLSEDGRVVILSSSAHEQAPAEGIRFDDLSGEADYSPWKAYGQSKLANLLMARELARRFEGSERTAFAVHPGVIPTKLGRHMNPAVMVLFALARPLVLKTIPQGAATQCWAAAHPDARLHSGAYLADSNVKESSANGQDMALAKKLWEVSEEITAAFG